MPLQRRAVSADATERPAPEAVRPYWRAAVPRQQTAFLAGAAQRPAPQPIDPPGPWFVERSAPFIGRPAPQPIERPGPWFVERPASRSIENARPEQGRPARPFSPAEPYPSVIAPVVLYRPSRPASRQEGYLPPRPATGPLSIGPHSHRRPRRWSPAYAASAVVLTVALGAGAVLYVWSQADTRAPVVATATTGSTNEVTLRAVLRGEADGLGVELTVGGLTPGASYQVYAATADDDLNLLGEFTGAAGPVRWSGTAEVPVDDLAYLSVGEAGGGRVLAAATVVRGSRAPL
ncbi:hypothetical protein AB0J90_24995 [Micromonospora sp. NPDC049523]|uniref:hypothetical protein n=1 Tax=Micromonospora sp. NPDC049523 TaxID=3155921 RepID=UPI00343551C0